MKMIFFILIWLAIDTLYSLIKRRFPRAYIIIITAVSCFVVYIMLDGLHEVPAILTYASIVTIIGLSVIIQKRQP